MTAIAALRIQTLTRKINKGNMQLMLLTQQQQTLSSMSSTIGREYKQLYTKINGVGNTVDAEQKDTFQAKLDQLEPVYLMINEKDTNIDEQIQVLNTQLKALNTELDNVKKYNEDNAKKEVVRY